MIYHYKSYKPKEIVNGDHYVFANKFENLDEQNPKKIKFTNTSTKIHRKL